jgi:hypothetical protein
LHDSITALSYLIKHNKRGAVCHKTQKRQEYSIIPSCRGSTRIRPYAVSVRTTIWSIPLSSISLVSRYSTAATLLFFDDQFRFEYALGYEQKEIRLIKREAGRESLIASEVFKAFPLYLKVSAEGQDYSFRYGQTESVELLLAGKIDGRILSTSDLSKSIVRLSLRSYGPIKPAQRLLSSVISAECMS